MCMAQVGWPYCIWSDPLLPACINTPGLNTTWCISEDPWNPFDPDPPALEISSVYRPETFCDNTPFVLVFSDEFEGDALDYGKWRTHNYGHYTGFAVNQHQNVAVADGEALLKVKNQPGNYDYLDFDQNPWEQSGYFEYTTASMTSYYKYHEGMYEARVRFIHPDADACDGTFPAFWIYGEKNASCVGTELDIFEYRGNNPNKWAMTNHVNTHCADVHRQCGACFEGGYPWDALTYRLYWDRHTITWWRSDVGVKRVLPRWKVLSTGQDVGCNSSAGYYFLLNDYPQARPIADHALEIALNIALDVEGAGATHDVSAFPVTMAVDYVRYYRRVPCLGVVTIDSPVGVLSSFGEYNYLSGTEVTLDVGIDLAAGQQLEIVATDFIDIDPAVTIANGSDFIARLGVSNCGSPSGLVLSNECAAPEEAQKAALVDLPFHEGEARTTESRTSPPARAALVAENSEIFVPVLCDEGSARIELVSCLGQSVLTWRSERLPSTLRIPVDGLASGSYTLLVQCARGHSSFRVLVP